MADDFDHRLSRPFQRAPGHVIPVEAKLVFIVVKPSAFEAGRFGTIISAFEEAGLHLSGFQERFKNIDWAVAHLAPQKPTPSLIDELTRGRLIGFGVTGPRVELRTQQIVGMEDPARAAPGSLRGRYGWDSRFNLLDVFFDHEQAIEKSNLFYDIGTDQTPQEIQDLIDEKHPTERILAACASE